MIWLVLWLKKYLQITIYRNNFEYTFFVQKLNINDVSNKIGMQRTPFLRLKSWCSKN